MKLLNFKIFIANSFFSFIKILRGFKDYTSFPFDPNLPMPENSTIVMRESTHILEQLGIDYYVCDGTALGLYRDGRFISHDNDIDVCVLDTLNVQQLKKMFAKFGYKVGRELYYKGYIQQIIFYSRENVIFDICVWRSSNDGYAYIYLPELKKGRRQPLSNFDGHDFLRFEEKMYPTHPNIEEWLFNHYGPDWNVPKSFKEDWRIETRDIIN